MAVDVFAAYVGDAGIVEDFAQELTARVVVRVGGGAVALEALDGDGGQARPVDDGVFEATGMQDGAHDVLQDLGVEARLRSNE